MMVLPLLPRISVVLLVVAGESVGELLIGSVSLLRIVLNADGDGGDTQRATGRPLASSARRIRSPMTGHRTARTARCAGT
jgi:hypothetical protein